MRYLVAATFGLILSSVTLSYADQSATNPPDNGGTTNPHDTGGTAVAPASPPSSTYGSSGAGTTTTTSTGSTSSAASATSGGTTTTTPTKQHKATAKKFKGYVVGVDETAKTFTIGSKPDSTDVTTYKVNDKTKYSPKGKGWDDVKAGAHVSGTFKNDGTDNWALTVRFWAEKAAPATKTGR